MNKRQLAEAYRILANKAQRAGWDGTVALCRRRRMTLIVQAAAEERAAKPSMNRDYRAEREAFYRARPNSLGPFHAAASCCEGKCTGACR